MSALDEFVASVGGFYALSGVEKMLAFIWHLQSSENTELITRDDLKRCFTLSGVEPPDLSVYLPRLVAKRPAQIIRIKGGYRLEGNLRRKLDIKYGKNPKIAVVSAMLSKLPEKIPSIAEREFLQEALNCYQVGAYRAAIVMTWNLAFDHLLNWISASSQRMNAFNSSYLSKNPKKSAVMVRVDFDEIKEFDTIEAAKAAKILPKNLAIVLHEKLKRRNLAAHPSALKIEQYQADDAISDLVQNVVLHLI